jgi:hypothetical protein
MLARTSVAATAELHLAVFISCLHRFRRYEIPFTGQPNGCRKHDIQVTARASGGP